MRWLPSLAIAGFCFALGIHLLTFTDVRFDQGEAFALIIVPALFAFPLWGLMILQTNAAMRAHSASRSALGFLSLFPRWSYILIAATFVYAFFNFDSTLALIEGGVPTRNGSTYTLEAHGAVLRTLSEEEFYRMMAYQIRSFSGHLLIFLLLPTLYFLSQPPPQQNAQRLPISTS